MEEILFKKLCSVARCVGILPNNSKEANTAMIKVLKRVYIILQVIYLIFNIYCVYIRYVSFLGLQEVLGLTITVVDLIEGINGILLTSCIYVSTYINSNEWTVFLNYLERCSTKLKSRNILFDILVTVFLNLTTLSIDCYQWVYLYLHRSLNYSMYIPFYTSNMYHTFLCSFLCHTATILIGTQKEIIDKIKITTSCSKTLSLRDSNKLSKRIEELANKFTEMCINIKHLNRLFGCHILFMCSESILIVLIFVDFLYMHKKQSDDTLLTTSDFLRTLLYMVST